MSIDIKERIRAVIDGDLDLSSVFYRLRAILDDLDAEPPKPTGEQLKAIGKILDGDAPREYAAGDRIWTELGMSRVLAGSETGRCRWHLKDAPETPALMICNHAGECKTKCGLKIPHLEVPECRIIRKMVYSTGCPFPDAVCVPWVEPVVHTSCEGCRDDGEYKCKHWKTCFDTPLSERHNYTPKPGPAKGDNMEKAVHIETNVEGLKITIRSDGVWFDFQSCKGYASLNISQYAADHKGKIIGPVIAEWCKKITPKEPEPVKEPDELPKDMFSVRNPDGQTYCERLWCKFRMQKEAPKEPEPVVKENFTAVEGEPGLIPCPIIGGKGNELWIVDMPWGNSIALYKAVGRKDFDHIETKLGAQYGIKVIALRAFDSNDPPVRAWFRQ